MKKLSTFCDRCKNLIEDDKVFEKEIQIDIFTKEVQEICSSCNITLNVDLHYKINAENRKNAVEFSGCGKCKYSGLLHKSIYMVDPGYYDDPDPTVYCTCKKGTALNPDTNYLVK